MKSKNEWRAGQPVIVKCPGDQAYRAVCTGRGDQLIGDEKIIDEWQFVIREDGTEVGVNVKFLTPVDPSAA